MHATRAKTHTFYYTVDSQPNNMNAKPEGKAMKWLVAPLACPSEAPHGPAPPSLTAPGALASVTAVSEHWAKLEAMFEADFVGKAPFRPLRRCDSCQAHASGSLAAATRLRSLIYIMMLAAAPFNCSSDDFRSIAYGIELLSM